MVGEVTEQGVPIASLRFARLNFSRMPSKAKKKKALFLLMGPPTAPPNCFRLKSLSGLPSDVCARSEEHTSELQSQSNLVCRLLLEKKKNEHARHTRALILDTTLFPLYTRLPLPIPSERPSDPSPPQVLSSTPYDDDLSTTLVTSGT